MSSNSFSPGRGRRVFICVRGKCAHPDQGKQLEKQLNQLIKQHGLDRSDHPQYTTCTLTNCLGVCQDGPIVMVHPEGIRYHQVDAAVLAHIFEDHFLHNRPVDAHIRRDRPAISALRKRPAPGKTGSS